MAGLGLVFGAPGFGVLPADVGGVVEVEQEAFAAVEEAEAEDVVPEEGEGGGRRRRSSRRRAGAAGLPWVTSRSAPRVL